MNQCPYCEHNIPSGTKTCPECGKRLPLLNRALDAFGGTIPALFQGVSGAIQRLIPGKAGEILGNVLGFAGIMAYIIALIVLCVALFVAARALLTGRIAEVDWFGEILEALEVVSRYRGE